MNATATPTVKVTTSELANNLVNLKGASFVTLIIESPIKTLAKSRVTKSPTPSNIASGKKRSIIFGIIGGKYSNAVNNQRDREGIPTDFEPQDHAWASYVDESPVMQHNKTAELYLAIQRRPAKNTNKSVYTGADGSTLNYYDISEYLKDQPRTSDSGSQGTEQPIQWLTLKLSNVIEARIGGTVYTISKPEAMTMAKLAARLATAATTSN